MATIRHGMPAPLSVLGNVDMPVSTSSSLGLSIAGSNLWLPQVLFKRKPVVIPPPQDIRDKNAQVCLPRRRRVHHFILVIVLGMYLSRIDFYKQSEQAGVVTVEIYTGEKLQGIVRDKTRFGSKQHADGSISEPFSRYFVSLDGKPGEDAVVDDDHISRDRKIFTKAVLRSFIKRTVTREAWNGAPWLVKHEYAAMHHIDTRIPIHLRHDTKIQERKLLLAQKKALHPTSANGVANNAEPVRLPELKPMPKSHKAKSQQTVIGMDNFAKKGKDRSKFAMSPDSSFQFPTGLRNGVAHVVRPATPPPPPPPKYPIEDLQSVGPLLETWDTLNVYCEIFVLDSFTFDDYVEALCVTSEQVPTQLLDEIHCSILKILVKSEEDGGKVEITLPEIEEEDEEDEDEDDEATPTPEPEPRPAKRATRSSLAKIEAERLAAEAAEAERQSQAERLVHRAEELLEDFDWIEHLRKRDFKNGGWEMILVGLLHQLSKNERKTELQQTLIEQYAGMDANFRVQIIQLLCMLTMETKAVRGYMEDCSEQMTAYRKGKIEWQRQRKQALEELKALHEQRKILLPDNMPPRRLRKRTSQRKTSRWQTPHLHQRKRMRRKNLRRSLGQEIKKKEEAELAAKVPKQSKQFIKLLKDIRSKEEHIKKCEDEIAVFDNDIREADCPRTRVLGKDRFWNRSTAHAGYANGCIWVQGPDELERQGYIDLPTEFQNEYKAKFNMTVPERKKREEGSTSLYTAHHWGFYSEPEELEELLTWLDPRGYNELRLRKEIVAFKDKIVQGMENRKTYVSVAEQEEEAEDDNKSTRMSTRTRARPTQSPEPQNYRCLTWENTMAAKKQSRKRGASTGGGPPRKSQRR
ncbi:unnamed protein product [Parascedosporium putredinis]|uniref:DDT domain-containing protein n=1 Tax=Parascedosporium putredinis TaxID=1442378 RepID=A0A9P1MDA4_9PEZI|nr:unnamed protein product [Parascedosporium putredinis]CAI8000082.1 unnamed protein product [Parascedosporium putredinis]